MKRLAMLASLLFSIALLTVLPNSGADTPGGGCLHCPGETRFCPREGGGDYGCCKICVRGGGSECQPCPVAGYDCEVTPSMRACVAR